MTTNNTDTELLVVFGMGADDKPRAARFKLTDEAAAQKAAELMWFRIGRATGEAALKLARKLRQGTISGSGKAFVPVVKREFYLDLLEVLDFDQFGNR